MSFRAPSGYARDPDHIAVSAICTVIAPELVRARLPWHDLKKTGLISGTSNEITVVTNSSGNAIINIMPASFFSSSAPAYHFAERYNAADLNIATGV
jgi:hypothetical protein